ncbi:MAG: prepilin-type N-terminal cleavage/methylation domain-containing protein, partial [Planctomycetes bacterium]|nr:prepilin-type N-terminal cleavage/methylation domain-containing protein [Planctomycetota bacterium]
MVFQNGKPPAGGFTLIELLVVSTVLAVLLGLSVGFLGRTDPDGVAASVLAGELRAAQLTARAEGLPTEVLVLPGADGAVATVQSRVLQPVVAFHFEPGSAALDDSLRPTLGGEGVPAGRFGHARRNRPGERTPLLRWAAPPEVADLGEGGALRVDLRLDARGSCVVLRLGGAVDLQLDDSGRPRARLRLSGGTAGAS